MWSAKPMHTSPSKREHSGAQARLLRTGKSSRETLTALGFLAPSLIGVAMFVVFPMADTIRRSFLTVGGEFHGFNNYLTLLGNEAFRQASLNTLKFLAVSVPLLLVLSMGVALIAQRAPDWFRTGWLIPLSLPVASLALLWRVVFEDAGLLNRMMSALGADAIPWMHSGTAFYVLVFSYLWKNIGYDMVLFLGGLANIPLSLYEAAQVDGAGRIKQFFFITLPQLTPVFFTVAVLSLLNAFKVFREAYLVAGNYPHSSMYMLQHLFNNWFLHLDIDKLCAAATVVTLVIFTLILLMQKMWGSHTE